MGRKVPWIVLALVLPVAAARAGPAHEHGAARLDVALEGRRVTLAFETPLDNLLGFERAPRNSAERQVVDAVLAALRQAAALWRFDPAARCAASAVELESAVLGVGAAGAAAEGHAELHASWTFDCAGGAPAGVEHSLFDSFRRLTRIDVQIAAERRQARLRLERPVRRIDFPR